VKKWFIGVLLLILGIGTNIGFVHAESKVGDTITDSTALTFQPSTEKGAIEINAVSTLTDQNDVDYYTFTLDKNGLINFDIQQNPTSEIGVTLYYPNGKELETYYAFKGNDKIHLFSQGLPKGKYFFKVYVESGKGQNLTYNVKGTFYERDDVELEDNNDFSTANPIKLGKEYLGFTDVEKDSYDVFRFTTEKNGMITVNGSSANVGLKYVLLNAKKEVIENWRVDADKDDSLFPISKTGLPSGTYYLAVEKTNGDYDNEPYHFKVDFKAGENYEKELNDTIKQANPINLNTTYTGILSSDQDKDFYRFTIAKNKKTSFYLTNAPKTSFKVKVLSSNGKVVKTFTTKKANGNNVKLADIDLKKGTYYLDIEFQQGDDVQIPYNFVVK
jgi:hypothetical protein